MRSVCLSSAATSETQYQRARGKKYQGDLMRKVAAWFTHSDLAASLERSSMYPAVDHIHHSRQIKRTISKVIKKPS